MATYSSEFLDRFAGCRLRWPYDSAPFRWNSTAILLLSTTGLLPRFPPNLNRRNREDSSDFRRQCRRRRRHRHHRRRWCCRWDRLPRTETLLASRRRRSRGHLFPNAVADATLAATSLAVVAAAAPAVVGRRADDDDGVVSPEATRPVAPKVVCEWPARDPECFPEKGAKY